MLVLLLTVVLGVVSGVAAGALMLGWRVEVGAPRVAPATVVEEVHRHLEANGIKVAKGTIVDATIIRRRCCMATGRCWRALAAPRHAGTRS